MKLFYIKRHHSIYESHDQIFRYRIYNTCIKRTSSFFLFLFFSTNNMKLQYLLLLFALLAILARDVMGAGNGKLFITGIRADLIDRK